MSIDERLRSEFQQAFGRPPRWIARAPGRVNLLGEHVDYNDGWVLPAAIDRAARIVATESDSGSVKVVALDLNESVVFRLDALAAKTDTDGNPLPGWARYPAGVAWVMAAEGLRVVGIDALLTSNIPPASGLSSSAAIEVAFALLWDYLGGWGLGRMSLAQLCQRAESAYVGVSCGLMDQFASLHGVAGCALLFDCRDLHWESVPLPDKVSVVIADSGVRRALDDSSYNQRRAECKAAARILAGQLPGVRALRDVTPQDFARHGGLLPPGIHRRAKHVIDECARVLKAVELLRAGDMPGFGAEMREGHSSLRDLYEVSCHELDVLVEIAGRLPGCHGARLTGAGFGGCTVNLVDRSQVEAFRQALTEEYHQRVGREATVWVCQAAEGGTVVPA